MARYKSCEYCGERLYVPFPLLSHLAKHHRERLRELGAVVPKTQSEWDLRQAVREAEAEQRRQRRGTR